MASNDNIDCTLIAEIDVTQEVAITEEVLDVEIITSTDDEAETIPRIEVELAVTQWSLVSDAIFIKNITGEEPAWFTEMIDDAIRNNEDLLLEFEEIQAYIDALNDGYTNLVSITDNHASQISALKVSSDEATAAIVILNDVKITEKQASAISSETITAWMRGGESAAWFNDNVQAVATDTSANTIAIIQLGAEVDGIEAGVIQFSEALVEKYENPEWVGPGNPDPAGEPEWLYRARAKHSLEVNANGSISGFIADAESGEEGKRSTFKIYADEFMVCDKVDPATGEPGYVAFSIRFDPLGILEPTIVLDGDVYFGNYPGHELQEYSLIDMVVDSVLDPVEKNNIEQVWSDIVAQHAYIMDLLAHRYQEVRDGYTAEYNDFTDYYAALAAYLLGLGIPRPITDPVTVHVKSDIDRGEFEENFKFYSDACAVMKNLIEDRVKQVADDSYNYIAEIVNDLIITPEEKTKLINELTRIGTEHAGYLANVPATDCPTYPNRGFEQYTKELLHYESYQKYDRSIYSTSGSEVLNPCGGPLSPPVFTTINGLDVQLNLAEYGLSSPTTETTINATQRDALLASSRWYVDSRGDLNTTILGTTVNTKFLRIAADDAVDTPYTLIIDDTIQTGVIGELAYMVDPASPEKAGWNLTDGTFRTTKKPIGEDPIYFRLDSEIPQTLGTNGDGFVGICQDDNQSNIRAKFIEGGIGSFGTLYSGDLVTLADKKHIVKSTVIKNVQKTIHMYNFGTEQKFTDSVRFYSPSNPGITPLINDSRIRKNGESVFTATMNGSFMDMVDVDTFAKLSLVLEYNVDDSNWVAAPNQILGLFNNHTIMFETIPCVNTLDFRMRIDYESADFPYMEKNVAFTIMLKN